MIKHNRRFYFQSSLESRFNIAGADRWDVMSSGSGKVEVLVGTGIALMLSVLLSWVAIYGLNRYLGSTDETEWTVRHSWTN